MAITEPVVNRSSQLNVMDLAQDAARRRRGTCLVVTGEPGGGKTHVLRSSMTALTEEGLTAFLVSCRTCTGLPFGPWVSLLEQTQRRLRDDPLAPALVTSDRPMTPRDHADRLLALWSTAGTSVVAMVDDAHLMNSSALQVVDHLLEAMTHESVVLVLGSSDDRLAQRWTSPVAAPVNQVRLERLSVHDVIALLDHYGPGASPTLLDRAAQRLVAECAGHPLSTVARLRRLAQRVAPGDLVEAVLLEPERHRVGSPHDWVRVLADDLTAEHREALARWTMAAGLTRSQFCEATDMPREVLDAAITAAVTAGLIESPLAGADEVSSTVREVMHASLTPSVKAHTHLLIGQALLRWYPRAVIEAARHLERATGLVPVEQLVDVLNQATDLALASYAYEEADRCAALADALSPGVDGRARRLLQRSRALRGQARWTEADELAREAASLAGQCGEADLMAQAAVELAIPADWRVGSPTTQRLLDDALAARPSPAWQVHVLAALAHQRLLAPRSHDAAHRWSWQFQPDVAAAVADEALTRARRLDDDDALIAALLAWRSVHRQPEHRERRRDISSEALSLAVRRRDTTAMVQAAVRVAVDELESGDREGFEHAVVVARWAADQAADARLVWRAHLLQATRAMLDGDLEALERAKVQAVNAGRLADAPGRDAAELVLDRHVLALSHGWSVVASMAPDANWPVVHHPLGVAGGAEALARAGRGDRARALLRRLRWPADANTSMLLVSALAGRAAVLCGDTDTGKAVLPTLVEYADHVAVDPEALWVEGPVALVGAQVAQLLGDEDLARDLLVRAELCNRTLDCARTASVLADFRRQGDRRMQLPHREHTVLRLLADGLGNAQIAQVLNFSVSTIRRETTSLYQRLGVANRAAAVAKAHELGLL